MRKQTKVQKRGSTGSECTWQDACIFPRVWRMNFLSGRFFLLLYGRARHALFTHGRTFHALLSLALAIPFPLRLLFSFLPARLFGPEYTDESTMVPRGTSVVVMRVPASKPGGILQTVNSASMSVFLALLDLHVSPTDCLRHATLQARSKRVLFLNPAEHGATWTRPLSRRARPLTRAVLLPRQNTEDDRLAAMRESQSAWSSSIEYALPRRVARFPVLNQPASQPVARAPAGRYSAAAPHVPPLR